VAVGVGLTLPRVRDAARLSALALAVRTDDAKYGRARIDGIGDAARLLAVTDAVGTRGAAYDRAGIVLLERLFCGAGGLIHLRRACRAGGEKSNEHEAGQRTERHGNPLLEAALLTQHRSEIKGDPHP
jgi:hypothetical protein